MSIWSNKLQSRINNDNLILTCQSLLNHFGVKSTSLAVSRLINNHLEYPSMLALIDCLSRYGIESAAIRKGNYELSDFEIPFVCTIQQSDWSTTSFTVVTNVDENTGAISYLSPITNTITSCSLKDFENIDKGIILLTDASNKKNEVNYTQNKQQQCRQKLLQYMPIFLVICSALIAGIYIQTNYYGAYSWLGLSLLLTSFLGLGISTLLVWHEVDAHNPFLKEVCGGQGKKVNCDAVLSSAQSSFLGISWSIWGFSYMTTLFLTQIFFANQPSFLLVSILSSLLVVPYIFFSLYYQWKVVKRWCTLCLGVQCVLLINSLLGSGFLVLHPESLDAISAYPILVTTTIGIISLSTTYNLLQILKKARDGKNYERKWKRLHYNPDIFKYLSNKSEKIIYPVDNLGIVLGNPSATNEIVKVCNTYCGPCSKAHPVLEQIVKANLDVKVRIIFTATGEEDDIRTAPVSHLLAIQQKYGEKKVHQALDEWYLTETKHYETFAAKYPINGELKEQQDKIAAMRDWCNAMKIRATPTIFVNGNELPESYRIADLEIFF
ncbi:MULTISPECIES: vitamin K epoxide reductase family protein [unclassified Sphingobacterium]|uniref:vitamin K epoxide reductase family protein n=1 Tax=unclassified Sphingobacterium TaxID=2609468 RepID=UPI0025F47557|nr:MULTISPECIES: vitamin K epoxide reductase family protein [unclassified Sphingobacterium]